MLLTLFPIAMDSSDLQYSKARSPILVTLSGIVMDFSDLQILKALYPILWMLLGIVIGCSLYYVLVTLYMLVASGRKVDKTGEEFIELKWVDGIYLEVFLAWCAALGFAIAWAFCELYEFYLHSRANYIRETGAVVIGALTFLLSVLLIESLCSFARRVKAHTFFKNSLIYKFCISQVVHFFRYFASVRTIALMQVYSDEITEASFFFLK